MSIARLGPIGVSTLWGVSLAQIHSRQRPNEVRDAAIYLCREVGAKPLGEIGAVLRIKGSAVSLAAKRMRQRSAADRGLRKRLEAAKNELINVSKTPIRLHSTPTKVSPAVGIWLEPSANRSLPQCGQVTFFPP